MRAGSNEVRSCPEPNRVRPGDTIDVLGQLLPCAAQEFADQGLGEPSRRRQMDDRARLTSSYYAVPCLRNPVCPQRELGGLRWGNIRADFRSRHAPPTALRAAHRLSRPTRAWCAVILYRQLKLQILAAVIVIDKDFGDSHVMSDRAVQRLLGDLVIGPAGTAPPRAKLWICPPLPRLQTPIRGRLAWVALRG